MTELQEKFEQLLLSTERPGIDKLIAYIRTTDFYTAPASTRFHNSCEGGLLSHSMNVYTMLKQKMETDLWSRYNVSSGTIIITALLHDLCKADFYTTEMRNKKDENGNWIKVPFYTVDDKLPYGHGEKSVYIINSFIKLTRDEAMAIRWHMGFSEPRENYNSIGKAMEMFPLIVALHEADMEATYLIESSSNQES